SKEYESESGRINIEARSLNSGVYLVKVNSNSGQSTKKLIVK
ncbi:T9SS type A sorting domain-containing protein, partial [Psychroflexus aestuariivivens]